MTCHDSYTPIPQYYVNATASSPDDQIIYLKYLPVSWELWLHLLLISISVPLTYLHWKETGIPITLVHGISNTSKPMGSTGFRIIESYKTRMSLRSEMICVSSALHCVRFILMWFHLKALGRTIVAINAGQVGETGLLSMTMSWDRNSSWKPPADLFMSFRHVNDFKPLMYIHNCGFCLKIIFYIWNNIPD